MAGTIGEVPRQNQPAKEVSMESGLDGRNNDAATYQQLIRETTVSMESGLDGRNNERAEKPTP